MTLNPNSLTCMGSDARVSCFRSGKIRCVWIYEPAIGVNDHSGSAMLWQRSHRNVLHREFRSVLGGSFSWFSSYPWPHPAFHGVDSELLGSRLHPLEILRRGFREDHLPNEAAFWTTSRIRAPRVLFEAVIWAELTTAAALDIPVAPAEAYSPYSSRIT